MNIVLFITARTSKKEKIRKITLKKENSKNLMGMLVCYNICHL